MVSANVTGRLLHILTWVSTLREQLQVLWSQRASVKQTFAGALASQVLPVLKPCQVCSFYLGRLILQTPTERDHETKIVTREIPQDRHTTLNASVNHVRVVSYARCSPG